MKTIFGLLGSLPVLLAGMSITSGAFAQDEQPPPQAAPPPTASAPEPPAAPQAAEVQAQGQWVYTDQYGWIWVPAGAEATTVNAQPYVYLYAPTYGWTWFVSPWGFGPYRAGPWIHAGPRWGVGFRSGYGYHGVAPHPYYRPNVGGHWGGAGHRR
jgi:hypothetical protein